MIKLENISKKYDSRTIIENFTYQFSEGYYQIIGNNGYGKSTLINIITGIDTDYTGNVYIDDLLLSKHEKLYNFIEYVNQDAILLPTKKVCEIANFCNNINVEKFMLLIEKEDINKEEYIKNLSGGQQQKISFLIGICSNKPIVIFDEPFNNLDKASIEKFDQYVSKMDNQIIIMINHESIKLTTEFQYVNLKESMKLDFSKKNADIVGLKVVLKHILELLVKKCCNMLLELLLF